MSAFMVSNSPVPTAICFPGSPSNFVFSQRIDPNRDGSSSLGMNFIGFNRNRSDTCFSMKKNGVPHMRIK